jgi:phosphohistidine swiveling domain-containing protein
MPPATVDADDVDRAPSPGREDLRTAADPVNTVDCDPAVAWTTGNVAEAFPGVFTALGFTFVHEPMELAFRTMFHRLGVFTEAELTVPPRVEDQFWTAFEGRAAANLDQFHRVASLTPGTSASAVEKQLFGYVRDTTVDADTPRRYPVLALKAPRTIATLPKRHDALFARLRGWRRQQLPKIDRMDERSCLDLIADARGRFQTIMVEHLVVAFVSSGLADRLAAMVEAAELPGLESRLLSGVGSDENEVAHDLWALAHDQLDLAEFLERHGYHGPGEGQLHGSCWREEPGPVQARLAEYRRIPADDPKAPRRRSAEQGRVRAAAVAELSANAGPLRRRGVLLLTDLTARFLALREQGKAGYLLAFDVARAASRRLGQLLVDRGVLATASDVFHLTYAELAARPTADLRQLVDERRGLYQQRLGLRLPQGWEGPVPVAAAPRDATDDEPPGTRISGVAASAGVVEGTVRVVRDPATAEVTEGDVLVCETTDPGWTSLFMVATAVVTDFGGMLSHGPIVARELGVPCVCGTRDGSRRLRDGQRVRVDGGAGTVEVLA